MFFVMHNSQISASLQHVPENSASTSPIKSPDRYRWHPVVRSKSDGTFNVGFTPKSKKVAESAGKALYAFRKKTVSELGTSNTLSPGSRYYVGKTDRCPIERSREHLQFSAWRQKANEDDTNAGTCRSLHRDFQECIGNGDSLEGRFEVSLLKTCDGNDDVFMEDLEREAIQKFGEKENLYNKNNGGGGGTSRSEYLRRSSKLTVVQTDFFSKKLPVRVVPAKDKCNLFEPVKWFRAFVGESGRVMLRLPIDVASFKGVCVYVWRTKNDGRRLYGYTGQKAVSERVDGYFKKCTHPDLLRVLKEKPHMLEFSLVELVGPGLDPGDRERAYITAFNTSKHYFGYNRNKGGGGGRPMIRPDKPQNLSQSVTDSRKYVSITLR